MATEPSGVRRELSGSQAGLVIGGLLLLLLVVYFLFLRGGGEPAVEETAPVTPPVVSPTPLEEDDSAPPGRGKGPLETFEVFAARDPFEPLIDPAGTDTTGGDTTGGTTGGDTGSDTGADTGGGGTGGGDAGGGDGGSVGGGEGGQNVEGHTVRLVDVFTANNGEQRAQVQVDGTVYTVEEGDRFADNFQLLSISGQCASILYGDDQFTICEGEEILK